MTLQKRPILITLVRFRPDTPIEQLLASAGHLTDGNQYAEVYVRRLSAHEWGLGLTYAQAGWDEDSYRRELGKVRTFLVQELGDYLIGWDIALEAYVSIRSA
jgi:hypothetical protein